MKQLIVNALLFAVLLFACSATFANNYTEGDTLYVVALNGLYLRTEPKQTHETDTKLNNGDTVVVRNTFGFTQYNDVIDQFKGNWVYVESVKGNIIGYTFDAFLSHYPVVNNLKTAKNIQDEVRADSYDNMGYTEVFIEYIEHAFRKAGCEYFYQNESDGEGYHHFEITLLEGNNKVIEHGYYEAGVTELELYNPRQSELYYLVKNITKQLPSKICKANDEQLRKTPITRPERGYDDCAVMTDSGFCKVKIFKKTYDGKHKDNVSIIFIWSV
jgi:uncharacterized protein YgiM (DUF1202 family)